MRQFKSILLFVLGICSFTAHATHQRAAEITYRWLQGLTYEVTITMYTYTPSPADDVRVTLPILWGDNSQNEIPRITFRALPDNYTLNVYQMNHTFPGPGSYVISVEDPNRNFGVVNIPNSVNVPIYVESLLVINPFLGENNSVQLLNAPVDQGCVGRTYYHNPSAFDPDGDSLSYKIVTCRGTNGREIPGYTLPMASISFGINAINGDVIWDAPMLQGEYNIAFVVEEWRSGILIGQVMRDMQILIGACNNNPPVIETTPSTCVIAKETLNFAVSATDPDNNGVILTGTGSAFELSNAATLDPDPATGTPTATATFSWNPGCNEIRKSSYNVLFKAKDNHPEVSLTSFFTTEIRVIAPPVTDLAAVPLGNGINLSWSSAGCNNLSSYALYRRNGSSTFVPGTCETGVPFTAGFTRIATVEGNLQSFRDDDNGAGLIAGVEYCYLITSLFDDGAESIASNQSCASLQRDLPLMTHVSNDSTNLLGGKVLVAWAPPTELDQNQFPGPYTYELMRYSGNDLVNGTLVFTGTGLLDTLFADAAVNLNTQTEGVFYEVKLKSSSIGLIGNSRKASSVLLKARPSNEAITLSWTVNVPWTNSRTEIFRREESGFVKIGTSNSNSYRDSGLVNNQSYTYYIRTFGSYSTEGIVDPIVNYSQLLTAQAKDIDPPCPPEITIETDCEKIENLIKVNTLYDSCSADIAKFLYYYSPSPSRPFQILDSTWVNTKQYLHYDLSFVTGCYYVKAVDSTGNVSDASATVCVDWDTCPLYELPNVFTPNGDGFNDVFVPMNYPANNPKANIEKVEMTILNRWGNVVFQTDDPAIEWNGKDRKSGLNCSDGTYFYVCVVFYQGFEGVVEKRLQGSISIFR